MNEKQLEKWYRENGIVIYIKGKPVYMIHPDNVENNSQALDSGEIKIHWAAMVNNVNKVTEGE